jgi:alpha-beta hydrolase superfamily lysophospholipase
LGLQNIAIEMQVDHSGNTVFVRGAIVPDTSLPPVVLLHDFGENGSLYREATKVLNDRGFSAVSFDMRGHGRSGLRLGHFENYRTLVKDLLQVCAWLRHKSHGRAPIVIAQGIGAAIAVSYTLRFPKHCHRLVLVNPVFKLRNGLSKPAAFIIKTIADILPHQKIPSGITPQMGCPIKYGAPGLIHQERPELPATYSATYIHEVLQLLEQAPGRFLRVKVPTLIIRNPTGQIANEFVLEGLLKRHKRRQSIADMTAEDSTHNLLTENQEILEKTLSTIQTWLAQVDQEAHEQPD